MIFEISFQCPEIPEDLKYNVDKKKIAMIADYLWREHSEKKIDLTLVPQLISIRVPENDFGLEQFTLKIDKSLLLVKSGAGDYLELRNDRGDMAGRLYGEVVDLYFENDVFWGIDTGWSEA